MKKEKKDEFEIRNSGLVQEETAIIHGKNGVMNTPPHKELVFAKVDDSVVQVGDQMSEEVHTFSQFPLLKEVVLSNSVRIIEYKAFENCFNLEKIRMPENLLYIGFNAFNNCEKLQSIDLYAGIQTIDEHAFSGCKNLKQVRYHGLLQHFKMVKLSHGCFEKGLKIICDDGEFLVS